jgi:predicted permease
VFHLGYFAVANALYKNAPEKQQTILRYSTMFTNAGFMGIPLISELISPEAAIYATFYVVSFNIYNWSLGCYMYSKDRSYISAKKMLINPATVPTYIGLFFFILGGFITIPEAVAPVWSGFVVPLVKDNILFLLKSTVIPLSMMMIGIRLAESSFKSMFTDKNIPSLIFVRLLAIPVCVAFILKGVSMLGILPAELVTNGSAVLVISSSTPVAAMATIFAERYDGDAVYASRIVSATTLISLVTMPLIAMLLLAVNI